MKAKHPPRTASQKPAKKAIIHRLLLNMARVRMKKRRDVDAITEQKRTTTVLPSLMHAKPECIADENQGLVIK